MDGLKSTGPRCSARVFWFYRWKFHANLLFFQSIFQYSRRSLLKQLGGSTLFKFNHTRLNERENNDLDDSYRKLIEWIWRLLNSRRTLTAFGQIL